jgi:hypothetical protein
MTTSGCLCFSIDDAYGLYQSYHPVSTSDSLLSVVNLEEDTVGDEVMINTIYQLSNGS